MILFRRWLREHDDGDLAQQAESDPAAANELLLQVRACACSCVGEAG